MEKYQNAYKLSDWSEYSLTSNGQNYTINPSTNGKEFTISDYLSLLGEKNQAGYYLCPCCGEWKLSINSDGKKYNCYSCNDTKTIASELIKRAGKFSKGKSDVISLGNGKNYINSKREDKHETSKSSTDRQKRSNLLDLIGLVNREFKGLRFNTQTLEPWLKDKPFSEKVCRLETFHVYLAERYGEIHPKERCIDTVMHIAQKTLFNPLEEYLKGLGEDFRKRFQSQDDLCETAENILSDLATTYLSTENPLYDEYLRNWILSAVGRVLVPGCYVRSALILQGEQNIGKTTFFQILGKEYFSSSLGDAKGKDELLVANRHWILEWGEFEGLWGRKPLSDVKSFMTRTEDTFRPPYGRAASTFARRFVLCGSTNQTDFLTDDTGNSRFWVIPCGAKEINLPRWEEAREEILAAATALVLYHKQTDLQSTMAGKHWQLAKAAHELDRLNAEKFTESHVWEEHILEVIDIWKECEFILPDKIWEALDIPIKERPKYRNQVSKVMNRFGWQYGFKWIDSKSKRAWIPKPH